VLTQWTAHVDRFADALRNKGHDPVVLRGGMGAKARAAALAQLQPEPGRPPLLAVATGPYIGEGFDCPALDTLFLAAPIAFKGRLVQYAGRIMRPHPGKTTAEIHDYHDLRTPVLAASLAKRAPRLHQPRLPRPPPHLIHARQSTTAGMSEKPMLRDVLAGFTEVTHVTSGAYKGTAGTPWWRPAPRRTGSIATGSSLRSQPPSAGPGTASS
jgi:superfamily II DNA or RNA helicase